MARFSFAVTALSVILSLSLTSKVMADGDDYTLEILPTLVECAGLGDALDGVTVFGPTDEAFGDFLEETGFTAEFLCGEGKEALTEVLLYHVIAGKVFAADVLALPDRYTSIPTVQGEDIVIDNKKLKVNRVEIIDTDVVTTPYVLHVIDEVLTIPDGTMSGGKKGKKGGKGY
jgi:uncharacterized surface protein with fasciclin (FAS1) repeats